MTNEELAVLALIVYGNGRHRMPAHQAAEVARDAVAGEGTGAKAKTSFERTTKPSDADSGVCRPTA